VWRDGQQAATTRRGGRGGRGSCVAPTAGKASASLSFPDKGTLHLVISILVAGCSQADFGVAVSGIAAATFYYKRWLPDHRQDSISFFLLQQLIINMKRASGRLSSTSTLSRSLFRSHENQNFFGSASSYAIRSSSGYHSSSSSLAHTEWSTSTFSRWRGESKRNYTKTITQKDVVEGFDGAVGNTPLVRLKKLSQETQCDILGKVRSTTIQKEDGWLIFTLRRSILIGRIHEVRSSAASMHHDF